MHEPLFGGDLHRVQLQLECLHVQGLCKAVPRFFELPASRVDKCVNSCAPRGAELAALRPSFSRSVSLCSLLGLCFPDTVVVSHPRHSFHLPSPGAASARLSPRSRSPLARAKMKFAALAAAAALFGASTVSASAAVHGHQDVAARQAMHRRGADRIQRLTKRASLSRSFLFRAHATDASCSNKSIVTYQHKGS